MAVQFHLTKKLKLKNPVLVEGFPGMGLVGTISASYLVDKLNMDFVGYLTSEEFPPLAAIHNHVPMFPARLYASKKYNLIVLLSEFIVPVKVVNELAHEIYEFANKNKVSQIVSLGAIVQKSAGEKSVFAVATNGKLLKELENHHTVEIIKEGVTTGVTGVLLARGTIERYPVVSFLAQASKDYMDPRAAANVLGVLREYLNLRHLNVHSLELEAQEVEGKMKELMGKAKANEDHYKKTVKDAVSNDLGAMYR